METLKLTDVCLCVSVCSGQRPDILGQLAAGMVDIKFWEVAELGEDVSPILAAQGD